MAIQVLNDGAVLLEQRTKINENFAELDTRVTDAQTDATAAGQAVSSKYTRPGSGIPSGDLTAAVQASLGKADSAIQQAVLDTALAAKADATATANALAAKADAGTTSAALAGKVPVAIVPVTASRAMAATDSGAVLVNSSASAFALSLIPGLGRVTLTQLGEGPMRVTLGTATKVTGVISTRSKQKAIQLVETSSGVYVGSPIGADTYRTFSGPLKKLGATAYDLTTHATVGVTALTRSVTGDYPRFSTATIKCDCSASTSQIRFQSINATADPDDLLFSIDVYLPFHPDEFGQTRYPVLVNPSIAIRLCNATTGGGPDSWTWSFDSTYLRQGWNTLKMWAGDTVGAAGAGTLPVGVARTVAGAGITFASAVQYFEITFQNMSGKTAYVDQLRRGAKANSKLVMGFDASGAAYNDRTFPELVAPLFAQYGTTGYTTLTNVYEMLFAGGASWLRQIELYNDWGWDALNHTWNHGGTEVGRNQTVTSARSGGNLITVTAAAAHNVQVGKVFWAAMRGAQDAAANGVFKCTATSATQFTYASTGTDGALLGTITWCTFLSEVFDGSDAAMQALLNHELGDISRTMRACGFQRSAHIGAYPNNMAPELSMLKAAAADAGLVLCRSYRSGMATQNEFGLDNPLHIGSIEMGSGAAGTTTTYVKNKLAGAIGRGDHMWTYGHYVLDETTLLPTVVDLEYPPSLGGNPAPPAAGLSGTGGWWYLGQIKRFLIEAVGPAIAAGTLELMTPTQFADYVGLKAK